MSIYAIGDLHLSFGENKPMEIFGDNWNNHTDKIKEYWQKNIKQDDLILMPGDFSWATYLEDTYKDFEYLNGLTRKKIIIKRQPRLLVDNLKQNEKLYSPKQF